MIYAIHEATENFDELIDLALAGEDVIICVDDGRAVQLMPIESASAIQLP